MAKRKMVNVEIAGENDSPTNVEISDVDLKLIDLYLHNGLNGTQAYLTLHPVKRNKKEKDNAEGIDDAEQERRRYDSARAMSSEILAKPNVKAIVNDRIKKYGMGVDEVVFHLSKIARSSHYPFIKFAEDGFVYFDFSHPEAQANMDLIAEIETKRERRVEGVGEAAEEWEGEWVKVKLHSRLSALRDLGKMHKLFVDRIERSGYSVEIPWDDLTPEQMIRLSQGVDPAIIKKEVDERKSAAQ
jgi:hypothetical protein